MRFAPIASLAVAASALLLLAVGAEPPAIPAPLAAEARPSAESEIVTCSIKTRDGGLYTGTVLAQTEMRMRVGKEKKVIRIGELRRLCVGKPVAHAELYKLTTLEGGRAVECALADLPALKLATPYGALEIPWEDISDLQVKQPRGKSDVMFTKGADLEWTSAGGAGWSMEDDKLVITQPNPNASILTETEVEGPYAIEVDVTLTEWAGILVNAADSRNATAVWLRQGTVSIYGNGSWTARHLVSWQAPIQNGVKAHLRVEVDGEKLTVLVNGVKAGETTVKVDGGKIGFSSYAQPATYENLSVER